MPRNARQIVGAVFFFNDTATTEIYTLSLHDALPICGPRAAVVAIARATESWVDETTVVEVTVTPAPTEALAPAWKFVPVTLTVRLAPGAPGLAHTLTIVTAANVMPPTA